MNHEIGKKYYCYMTERILTLEDLKDHKMLNRKTAIVSDEYSKKNNFTWSLKYLKREASSQDILNYKNKLNNQHSINDIYLELFENGEIYLDTDKNLITKDEFDKISKIVNEGFKNVES